MKIKYYIVDVFTKQAFNGAQVAVFPNASELTPTQMQLIARELNLSESVFIYADESIQKKWRVRIFSPYAEIDFAGHPLLAVAYTLAEIGEIKTESKYTDIIIEQNSGDIEVSLSVDKDEVGLIQFELTSQAIIDCYVPADEDLAKMLTLEVSEIEKIKYTSMLASSNKTYLIIPVRSFEAARKARFDYQYWSQSVASTCMARDILLFSTQSDSPESSFHARLIGPDIGIKEDPPVASAMPAFGSYLIAQKNVADGRHTFTIDRGTSSTRKSLISIELEKNKSRESTISIGGYAVSIASGEMILPV